MKRLRRFDGASFRNSAILLSYCGMVVFVRPALSQDQFASQTVPPASRRKVVESYGKLLLSFEASQEYSDLHFGDRSK